MRSSGTCEQLGQGQPEAGQHILAIQVLANVEHAHRLLGAVDCHLLTTRLDYPEQLDTMS